MQPRISEKIEIIYEIPKDKIVEVAMDFVSSGARVEFKQTGDTYQATGTFTRDSRYLASGTRSF